MVFASQIQSLPLLARLSGNKYIYPLLLSFVLCNMFYAFVSSPAMGGEKTYHLKHLEIAKVWSKPIVKDSLRTPFFLKITNHGSESDVLLSASSPIAEKIEILSKIHRNGNIRLITLDLGLTIPAKEAIHFDTENYCLVLSNINKTLTHGQSFPIKLRFKTSGEIAINVLISNEIAIDNKGIKSKALPL